MAIVRWRPYREAAGLQNEMNRLFESFMGRTEASEGESSFPTWGPRVDIHEDGDKYMFEVEIPGVDKADVKLSVKDDTLTIEGDKKYGHDVEDEGCNCHRQERVFGKFRRVFTMPTAVEAEKISAAYKNGILSIDLPKKEAAKPKEITISVK